MNYKIGYRRVASRELEDAIQWYRTQSDALADRFARLVTDLENEIRDYPHRYPTEEDDIRCAIMQVFPHAPYYRIVRDRIYITAVYHHSRDPDGWKNRH